MKKLVTAIGLTLILFIALILTTGCEKSPEERLEEIATLGKSGDFEKAIDEYRRFSEEYPDETIFIQRANELADELVYKGRINEVLVRECANFVELRESEAELINALNDIQTPNWKEDVNVTISQYLEAQRLSILKSALTYDDTIDMLKELKVNGSYLLSEETIDDLLTLIERIRENKSLKREDLNTLREAIKYFPKVSGLKEQQTKLIDGEFNRWVNNRTRQIHVDSLTYTVLNTKRGKRSLSFDHDEFTRIHSGYYYEAERGYSYISVLCNVKSTSKSPTILDFEIYKIIKVKDDIKVSLASIPRAMRRRYNYRSYRDYLRDDVGTYNDFRYTDSVKFVWCDNVPDINNGYYIVVLPKSAEVEKATNPLDLVENYFIVAKY